MARLSWDDIQNIIKLAIALSLRYLWHCLENSRQGVRSTLQTRCNLQPKNYNQQKLSVLFKFCEMGNNLTNTSLKNPRKKLCERLPKFFYNFTCEIWSKIIKIWEMLRKFLNYFKHHTNHRKIRHDSCKSIAVWRNTGEL